MPEKPTYEELEKRIRELEQVESERLRTEEALRRSKKRYRLLIEHLNDLVVEIDPKGRFLFVSPSYCKTFGKAEHELLGQRFMLLIHEEDREPTARAMEDLFRPPHKAYMEQRAMTKSGWRWLAWSDKARLDENGRIESIIGVERDITDRKRAEDMLKEWHDLMEYIIRYDPNAIAVLDKDLKHIFVSDRFINDYRVREKDIIGKHHYEIFPDIPERWRDIHQRALAGETIRSDGDVFIRKDGTTDYNRWECRPWHKLDGAIGGIILYTEVITERKRVEKQLAESQRMLRNVIDTIPVRVFWKDRSSRFLGCNRLFARDAGRDDPESLISEYDFNMTWTDQAEMYRAVDFEVMKSGKPQMNFEELQATPDGKERILRTSKIPLRDEDGNIYGILGTYEDITAQKRADAEHEKLREQLIQAQKMEAIGTLAGGIAHNFNNILMGIQGRTSLMLLDKGPSDSDYEHLKGIEAYVQNAVELTKDLLGFAREGKYELKPVDLNAIIIHENQMFGQTRKEIRIHGKYEKDLWPVEVDEGQVRQVLLNLYVNAWQAMPGGGNIHVRTENVTFTPEDTKTLDIRPGRYVRISITDTGVGMDDETRKKVFEPFFTSREVGQGSGLGLASVYGIIKHHGGLINVYSKTGEGATFDIFLPASEKSAAKERQESEGQRIEYGQETILFVDDEKMILDVGHELLRTLGYRSIRAGSGHQAVQIYRQTQEEIDLVILDMTMPGMSGGETYHRLKAIDENVKVLLSSGYSITGLAKETLDQGAVGFIQKPFTLETLSQKLREVLIEDNDAS